FIKDPVPNDGTLPKNLVTPTLDLGSVIHPPKPGIPPHSPSVPDLPLGETSLTSFGRLRQDLPRDPSTGAPLIPETRNDNNTPVAQMHVALIKFINSPSKALRDSDVSDVRKTVVQHFQSVVLHDYLAQVAHPD